MCDGLICSERLPDRHRGQRNQLRGYHTHPKLLKLLTGPTISLIVMEHKNRLVRFGFNYIEQLLAIQVREIEVIDLAENGKEDLTQDLVSIVTSLLYPLVWATVLQAQD